MIENSTSAEEQVQLLSVGKSSALLFVSARFLISWRITLFLVIRDQQLCKEAGQNILSDRREEAHKRGGSNLCSSLSKLKNTVT